MSDFKCAIIGVGQNRSRGLAAAYAHIDRGHLASVSARTEESRSPFARQFNVANAYGDYREMFEKERPDLVHVNTPPDVRLEVMEAAEAAGVPALIVEKPLAVQVMPAGAFDQFVEDRTDLFFANIGEKLPNVRIDIIDSKGTE